MPPRALTILHEYVCRNVGEFRPSDVMWARLRCLATGPCLLTGWSGSAAYNILQSIIKRVAQPLGKTYVSPMFRSGRPILSGFDDRREVLEQGSEVEFEVLLMRRDLAMLLESLSISQRVDGMCPVEVVEVEFGELEPDLGDEKGFAVVDLEFYPTAFMFHGKDVLYPSPSRLAFSLAKNFGEIFNVSEVKGVKLKDLAKLAPTALELIYSQKLRVGRLNIGNGREVPVFFGKVKLAVYGNLGVWIGMLKLGEKYGVGVSRAIGLGRYKVLQVERLA